MVQYIVTDTVKPNAEDYYLFWTEWYKILYQSRLSRAQVSIKAPAHQHAITTKSTWPCHAFLLMSPTFPRLKRTLHPRPNCMEVPRLWPPLPLFHNKQSFFHNKQSWFWKPRLLAVLHPMMTSLVRVWIIRIQKKGLPSSQHAMLTSLGRRPCWICCGGIL